MLTLAEPLIPLPIVAPFVPPSAFSITPLLRVISAEPYCPLPIPAPFSPPVAEIRIPLISTVLTGIFEFSVSLALPPIPAPYCPPVALTSPLLIVT